MRIEPQNRLRLIDGMELTELMVRYNVGRPGPSGRIGL